MKTRQLQKLYEDYIEYCRFYRRLREQTLKNYLTQLKVFFELMPEVCSPGDLTTKNIVEFFRRLEVRKRKAGRNTIVTGVKKSTIESYWNKLNPFFEWLVVQGELEGNPLRKLRKTPAGIYR